MIIAHSHFTALFNYMDSFCLQNSNALSLNILNKGREFQKVTIPNIFNPSSRWSIPYHEPVLLNIYHNTYLVRSIPIHLSTRSRYFSDLSFFWTSEDIVPFHWYAAPLRNYCCQPSLTCHLRQFYVKLVQLNPYTILHMCPLE